jgi:non-ribosomal peptide synthetase component F
LLFRFDNNKPFACYFKYQCVKPGMLVGVISNAPLERIASILVLWKLGAAYLPIDPNYPIARINFILDDSKGLGLVVVHYWTNPDTDMR